MLHQTTNLGVRSSNLFGRATQKPASHRHFFALRRRGELLGGGSQVTEKELCGRTAPERAGCRRSRRSGRIPLAPAIPAGRSIDEEDDR